jgi:quercetin dioxygenase-like cupin family protein
VPLSTGAVMCPSAEHHPVACYGMAAVRDFSDELEGYAYLPRLFDKARARLRGDTDAPPFGCPLDHSCLARLRVYPESVLELVSANGDDDRAILGGLRELGIPSATEAWFDGRATEDELLTGVYLKVRPRELLDELQPRPGQRVVAVEEGEALFFLGDHQMRIVRSGEVVRVPPELPHRIESIGEPPLRLDWLTGDPVTSPGIVPSQSPAVM